MAFVDFDNCHQMVSLRKLYCDLDLLFEGQKFYICISETVRASTKKSVGDICRFWHLPLNGVIKKIILCDLYLLFED